MDQVTIQSPTPSLEESIRFYEKLGFRNIPVTKEKTIYTDGQVLIEINEDRFARLGFKFYRNTWADVVEVLKKHHPVLDIPQGHLTTDPNGIWIYLISGEENDISIQEESFSKLGKYAGISVESISMTSSLAFYQIFGLTISAGSLESPWMTLSHQSGFSISFMAPLSCPHLFFNPSLTYFNGKSNPNIIAAIRNEGIPITEEITHFSEKGEVDNIIIRDPGGLGFFIFND